MTRRRSTTPRKDGLMMESPSQQQCNSSPQVVKHGRPQQPLRVKSQQRRAVTTRTRSIIIIALVLLAFLSLSLSLVVLNQQSFRGHYEPDPVLTTREERTPNPHLGGTQRNEPQQARRSWIDRWLRKKVSLSDMESLRDNDVDDEAIYNGFTGWDARGGRGEIAIFYNIYIPPPPDLANALAIVEEQIRAIGHSPVSLEPFNLYYNLIGNKQHFNATDMTTLCQKYSPNLKCQLLNVYPSASESVTLQAMHDFCHNHNDHHRVIYLHTKGAFHASDKNAHWRRLLTHAALHPDCVRPPQTCNLCGLQFFTQFTSFVPGNMFAADCSYVQKLLPLDVFRQRQEEHVKQILLLKLQNQLRASIILKDQMDYFGIDRYSDEHWIGSHPDVLPCDLDPWSDIAKVFNGTLKASQFEWKLAPRIHGVVGGIGDDRQAFVHNHTDLRRREILLLPGLIQRWWRLYEKLPKSSSWIWEWFPDSDFWGQAIQQFGPEDAVLEATAKYRYAADGMPMISGFGSSTNGEEQVKQRLSLGNQGNDTKNSTASRAVFYHILLSNDDEASYANTKRLIAEQINLVSSSSKEPVTLWYTIAGKPEHQNELQQSVQARCDEHNQLIQCRSLGFFDDLVEGESLRFLHHYCSRHPSDSVSYIHTLSPTHLRLLAEGNANLILSLTKAALSSDCVNALTDTCNVCGLIFFNLWTHFFPGNMFTADCKYVRKLLAPHDYEIRMNKFIGDLLMMKLRNILVNDMFPERPDILGFGRHSLEYWIGSHPELIPCDLSNETQDLFYWGGSKKHEFSDFHLGLAPRRTQEAPFGMDIRWNSLEDESNRLREYSLLPGHILRWNYFYNQTPGPFAWQWFSAPDGLKWMRAQHDFGNEAVLSVTAEFAKDVY